MMDLEKQAEERFVKQISAISSADESYILGSIAMLTLSYLLFRSFMSKNNSQSIEEIYGEVPQMLGLTLKQNLVQFTNLLEVEVSRGQTN